MTEISPGVFGMYLCSARQTMAAPGKVGLLFLRAHSYSSASVTPL